MKLKVIVNPRPTRVAWDSRLVEIVDADTGERVSGVAQVEIDRQPDGRARVTLVLEGVEVVER